jgi:type IV pilus biogenesis protein CpaD/CtpE
VLRRRARHRDADRAGLSRRAVWLCALVLAGCGGDDGATTTTTTTSAPLTKAEFVRQADQICLSGDLRIEAAADDLLAGGGEPPPAQVRRIALRIVVPGLEAEVRAIRALGAPVGDEATVARILHSTERGIAQIKADPEGAIEGPPPGLREAGRLARRYGSEECGAR